MRTLDKRATEIFFQLIAGLNNENTYRKIDNTNGTYMSVNVEKIGNIQDNYDVYAISHSYEQNGDLMRDPEMTFLVAKQGSGWIENVVFPASYQLDSLGSYQESILFKDGKIIHYPRLQKSHAVFANTWLKNIKKQQGKIKPFVPEEKSIPQQQSSNSINMEQLKKEALELKKKNFEKSIKEDLYEVVTKLEDEIKNMFGDENDQKDMFNRSMNLISEIIYDWNLT